MTRGGAWLTVWSYTVNVKALSSLAIFGKIPTRVWFQRTYYYHIINLFVQFRHRVGDPCVDWFFFRFDPVVVLAEVPSRSFRNWITHASIYECAKHRMNFFGKTTQPRSLHATETKIKYQLSSLKLFNLLPLLFVAPAFFPRERSGPIFSLYIHVRIYIYINYLSDCKTYKKDLILLITETMGTFEICFESFLRESFGLIITTCQALLMCNAIIIPNGFTVFHQDTDCNSPCSAPWPTIIFVSSASVRTHC